MQCWLIDASRRIRSEPPWHDRDSYGGAVALIIAGAVPDWFLGGLLPRPYRRSQGLRRRTDRWLLGAISSASGRRMRSP